jgi:hypothetical protein
MNHEARQSGLAVREAYWRLILLPIFQFICFCMTVATASDRASPQVGLL